MDRDVTRHALGRTMGGVARADVDADAVTMVPGTEHPHVSGPTRGLEVDDLDAGLDDGAIAEPTTDPWTHALGGEPASRGGARRRPRSTVRRRSVSFGMDAYLEDVGRCEAPLSREEEFTLGVRSLAGDREARDRLVRANMRFVVQYARRYQGQGLDLYDLVAFGNVGLLRAAEKFDPHQGVKFISYAVWAVRQAIQAALQESGRLVRLPGNRRDLQRELYRAARRLTEAQDGPVSAERLAEEVQADPAVVRDILAASSMPYSFEARIGKADGTATLGDVLASPETDLAEAVADSITVATLHELLDTLQARDERDAYILRRLYGFAPYAACSLQSLGDEMGITRERVRQLRERALLRLRALPGAARLAADLVGASSLDADEPASAVDRELPSLVAQETSVAERRRRAIPRTRCAVLGHPDPVTR